jgi:16S rRNA (adenine1518-N6/adenine1519-N6)-dimethyltransferase
MRQPLGQHFLRDAKVVQTILAAAELQADETALEIGPGKGVLTEGLITRVRHLTAVELDGALAGLLEQRYLGDPRLRVVRSDFLKVDLDVLFPSGTVKILGNLPYAITSPIFEKILAWPRWETGVFLIQREVADRMRSEPGSRIYGILSLAVQVFAQVESILLVKPGAFVPPPQVDSTVIRLRRKTTAEVPPEELPAFFDLVHAAFAHRRKTLLNSLSFCTQAPKEKIASWLALQKIEPNRRAETLGLLDYSKMAKSWAIFRRENDLT